MIFCPQSVFFVSDFEGFLLLLLLGAENYELKILLVSAEENGVDLSRD